MFDVPDVVARDADLAARVARQAQSELFRAPDLVGGAGELKPLRKLQRRAPSVA